MFSRMAVTRATTPTGVIATAPLSQSTQGSSGSFLVLADDGRRYWCKSLNNFQDPRVPVNEQIVAKLGQLIGAPVCEPQLVRITEPLVGWEIRPNTGRLLERGWAHGSLAVEPAVETHSLDRRSDDDNVRRHAGIFALFDWVGGSDPQWLMVGSNAMYFSHDHGHYFPGGPSWTAASLQGASGAFQPGGATTGLERAELERLVDRLEAVSQEEVEACVSNLPADWPVGTDELEALVEFVYGRTGAVAQRLRALVAAV
jgi:hypothetical protein